jgi:type II secretory pathway pseudopilin PulG
MDRSGLRLRWRTHGRGFSALELLVIFSIVGVVAAIGVPTLHARARVSVLETNLESLGSLVSEQVAEGYSPQYRESGKGDPEVYLSNHLEESLGSSTSGGYVNPTVSAGSGSAVLNTSSPLLNPLGQRMAVLITDNPELQYVLFNMQPESGRQALAGTLIVAFNDESHSIDVFYVDAKGKRSGSVVSVPLG